VFGSQSESSDTADFCLSRASDTGLAEAELCKGELVAKVLRIPLQDAFAVSATFNQITMSMKDQMSEVYASQTFLDRHIAGRDFRELNSAAKLLRSVQSRDRNEHVFKTHHLMESLRSIQRYYPMREG